MPYDYLNKTGLTKFWNKCKSKFLELPSGGKSGDVLSKTDSGVEWATPSSDSEVPEEMAKIYFDMKADRHNNTSSYDMYIQYNGYPNSGTPYSIGNITAETLGWDADTRYKNIVKGDPNSFYLVTVENISRTADFTNAYARIKGPHFYSYADAIYLASLPSPGSFYAETDASGNMLEVNGTQKLSTSYTASPLYSFTIEKINIDYYGQVNCTRHSSSTTANMDGAIAIGGSATVANNNTASVNTTFKFAYDGFLKLTFKPARGARGDNQSIYTAMSVTNNGQSIRIQPRFSAVNEDFYTLIDYKKNTNLVLNLRAISDDKNYMYYTIYIEPYR